MDYDSFLELVKNRRTIRRFRSDPVPDEYIEKIIEAARWAPSGYNSQPWEFVVLKDKKLISTIMQWIDDYRRFSRAAENARESWMKEAAHPWLDPEMDYRHASVYIIIFGDTRTQDGLPMMIRYDNQQKQTIYLSSLANAYLYMSLAATTLGLANEWVSAVAIPYAHCLLKELLGIPKDLEVYDMMALGYPAYKDGSLRLLRRGRLQD
jgi:nitroreductase